MDCSSCSADQTGPELSSGIDQSADQLATLLAQTPEFQELVRMSRLVNQDPDVRRLSMALNDQQTGNVNPGSATFDALMAELEALPLVQTYRQVEAAVRELFQAVDQVISEGAGMAFAPNALHSACG